MTLIQRDLLRFIERYLADHDGVAPSYAEMCAGIGFKSKGHLSRLIMALEERGRIRRLPSRARSVEVVPEGQERPLARPGLRLVSSTTEALSLMALSSPRTLTGPAPEPDLVALHAAYAAAERKARSEPFDFADAEAARLAWRAYATAGGFLPGPADPDAGLRRLQEVGS